MEHKYLAKRYWADKPTAMGKSDVLARSFNDVINLSLGDPDMITPELIIDKAFEDAKAGYTKYTDFRGMPELRQEIAKFYKEEYGLDIPDE
ncbi:MAG: aminotransferase class I/II-fold pyridoxal phosphate-dependent enzyme, partial [Firmicutes bacterium]|nr:aminotransferase class I/II-fold pyridoxal phosphate-dependent enzyme [Bacillota bacterium]